MLQQHILAITKPAEATQRGCVRFRRPILAGEPQSLHLHLHEGEQPLRRVAAYGLPHLAAADALIEVGVLTVCLRFRRKFYFD